MNCPLLRRSPEAKSQDDRDGLGPRSCRPEQGVDKRFRLSKPKFQASTRNSASSSLVSTRDPPLLVVWSPSDEEKIGKEKNKNEFKNVAVSLSWACPGSRIKKLLKTRRSKKKTILRSEEWEAEPIVRRNVHFCEHWGECHGMKGSAARAHFFRPPIRELREAKPAKPMFCSVVSCSFSHLAPNHRTERRSQKYRKP